MSDQPQLQQPETLENVAKMNFVKWMISPLVMVMTTPMIDENTFKVVRKDVDFSPEGVAALQKYVINLPGLCQHKILAELMKQMLTLKVKCPVYRIKKRERTRLLMKIVEEYNIMGVMLGVLFTEKIKGLKLCFNEMATFGDIFGKKGYLLSGLIDLRLDLDCVVCDQDEKNDENDEAEKEEKSDVDNEAETDDGDEKNYRLHDFFNFIEYQSDAEYDQLYEKKYRVKESNILAFLEKLHGLRCLSLKCCTDKILRCVIENCKLIEKLELYCDLNLKSNIVELLVRLSNLKSIDLHFSLFDIERYGTEEKIKKFLELIVTQSQFYIRSFASHETESTPEQLQMVIKKYPYIQSLSLSATDSIRHSLERYKKALTGLKNLEELEIHGFDFYEDGVKEVLDSVGGNLKKLVLRFNAEIDLNVMKVISLNFPMLQKLAIINCFFKEMDTTSNLVPPNLTKPALLHLQSFELSAVDTRSPRIHLPPILSLQLSKY